MSKSARLATWIAVLLAILNPLPALGTPPAVSRNAENRRLNAVEVKDVQLDARGSLRGVVVDAQGKRQAAAKLTLSRVDRPAERTVLETREDGQFATLPIKPGVYRLETSEGVIGCRLWSSTAAPPSASKSLLVVNDTEVVRGQRPIRELFYSDPLLMAGVVAAAIAIPIAVHKSRDDAPEGS